MLQSKEAITIEDFNKGLITKDRIISKELGYSPNCMDVKWNFDGSIQKRYGCSTQNTVRLGSTAVAGWTLDSSTGLSTNIQAYWKMDETANSRDDSFGTNHLSDYNTVLSQSGIRGNAADFVSTNSEMLVRATTGPLQTGGVPFSISSWFYLNSTSSTVESTIVGKRDGSVDSATVLLLHCDGADASTTFTDSSSSAHTVTANGNAQVDTAQSQFGGASALFDGSGDYLSIPDTDDFDFGTEPMTIDCWFRANSLGVTQNVMNFRIDSDNSTGIFISASNKANFNISVSGTLQVLLTSSTTILVDTWHHIAITRSGNTFRLFLNGIQEANVDYTGSTIATGVKTTFIGSERTDAQFFNGHIDEVRITNGVARWTSNFTVADKAYGIQEFEYWLYVNTDSVVTFRVSSTGTVHDGSIRATSHGVVALNTWYNAVAFHQTGASAHIGVSVNLSANSSAYTGTVRVGSAPFSIGALSDSLASRPTRFMNGRIDEVGFWKRGLLPNDRSSLYGGGTASTYSAGASGFAWAMYDFGASNLRWLTVAVGTGISASSNLGVSFVVVATTRTQNYQYFNRSKNILIATSDSYDVPLYWAGSVGTFFATIAPNSAPGAKFSANYQGFCILLNSQDSNGVINKRRFHYVDDNVQLTSTWQDFFDLPSSDDDELTGWFVLNTILYVSTKYRIFKVSFVGGNPDWSYEEVKQFGYVPRTIRRITIAGGDAVVGLDWSRRLRMFDGSDDLIISDNMENENSMCDFATKKISFAGSGLVVSHAEYDPLEQEYRMNLAIGANSTQTTHALLLNARTLAMYPYANQMYQCMCVAESAGRQFLMAADRSGFVYILNTGNLDVATPINEVYDFPFLYQKLPGSVHKAKKIDLYFSVDSCGSIYFQDRADFSSLWSNNRSVITITEADSLVQKIHSIDIPATQNVWQGRIMSSSGTANPWKLNHIDFFSNFLGIGVGNG